METIDMRIQFLALCPTIDAVPPGEGLIWPLIVDECNAAVEGIAIILLAHVSPCSVLYQSVNIHISCRSVFGNERKTQKLGPSLCVLFHSFRICLDWNTVGRQHQ